ncbi:MAG: SusC/RagA family TonB-linked outer membrane protein, partial [Pedobacter sp.]
NNGVFEDVRIQLRGIRSLLGDNNPMLLLDGVPVGLGYLSSLNPNDIADVNVLKGSQAATIYGNEGRNGVIIVTTKKGTNAPVVTFGHSTQFSKISFFPAWQTTFGSGGYGSYIPYENWSWGDAYDGSTRPIGRVLEDGSQQTAVYSARPNERKDFFETGMTMQNDVSYSAKDFYISFQDANIHGIVPNDRNRRTGIRLNTGKEYGKFKVQFNLNYIQSNYNVFDDAAMGNYQASQGVGLNGGLLNLIFNTPAHIPLNSYKDYRNNKFASYDGYFNDYGHNPYFALDNWRQTGKNDDLITNIEMNFKATSWLNFTYRAAATINTVNAQSTTVGQKASPYAVTERAFSDVPAIFSTSSARGSRMSSEAFATVTKQFNDLKLTVNAGTYMRESQSKSIAVGVTNLNVPELYNVGQRTGEPLASNSISKSRILAFFGSAGLSYKGWANVEVAGRNETTSLLPLADNSYFYPGVSG